MTIAIIKFDDLEDNPKDDNDRHLGNLIIVDNGTIFLDSIVKLELRQIVSYRGN